MFEDAFPAPILSLSTLSLFSSNCSSASNSWVFTANALLDVLLQYTACSPNLPETGYKDVSIPADKQVCSVCKCDTCIAVWKILYFVSCDRACSYNSPLFSISLASHTCFLIVGSNISVVNAKFQ